MAELYGHADDPTATFRPSSGPLPLGYKVFLTQEETAHELFTNKLKGCSNVRGGAPMFYDQLKDQVEEILREAVDLEEDSPDAPYRRPHEPRVNLSNRNYKQEMQLNLAVSAGYLIDQLRLLSRDTCYISRREQPHEFTFHISGCDQDLAFGDYLIATNDETQTVFVGIVKTASLTEVVAKMPRQFVLARDRKKVKISFSIRWTSFIIQENALHAVWKELGRPTIFPDATGQIKPALVTVNDPWQWHNPQMNHFQREAISAVLKAVHRPIPHLISGPPGTGKTSTLIEYLHQVFKHLPKAKILVCAPSNTAANVVLKQLVGSRWIDVKKKVIRMTSYSHIISGALPGNHIKYFGTLPITEPIPNGIKVIASKGDLCEFSIVITTVNFTGNFFRMGLTDHFTHLVVDEAGQALETETLVPFTMMKKANGHLALFGDEKQLGPVVFCNQLKDRGFGVSMFERLARRKIYYEAVDLYHRLLNNYRSVPRLLKFYNELFYHELLIAMVRRQLTN